MDYYSFFEKLLIVVSKMKFTDVDTKNLLGELNISDFYHVVKGVNEEFAFNDGMVKL